MARRIYSIARAGLLCLLAQGFSADARAHGGVVSDEDLCIMEIGVFRAHFTIYQPETRASEEFCEDIPDVTRTLFVMEYLHDSLREVPVDFRIVRDVMGRTIYASWEDILRIPDLESATVFHRPGQVQPGGALTVEHEFSEAGWYTGIVTTRHPTLDKSYQAVFGFHVGGRGWGYWPWLILLAAALQAHFWLSGGGLKRWRAARARRGSRAD